MYENVKIAFNKIRTE